MPRILQKEIDSLKKAFLSLGTLVEENFQKSIKAFEGQDAKLAEEVIKTDQIINEREVELEEECLKILALHQPVAGDLRFIIGILKINSDLERVGDLAVNISKRVKYFSAAETPGTSINLAEITQKTTGNDPGIFNSWCTAESGDVRVCSIAPSLLFSDMELQRIKENKGPLPIVPTFWAGPDIKVTKGKKKKR